MRLGQFSRKFDLSIPNIVTFLSEHPDFQDSSFHPNIRLDPALENEILTHFGRALNIETAKEQSHEEDPNTEEQVLNAGAISKPAEDERAQMEISPDLEKPKEKPKEALTPAEEIAAVDGEVAVENSDTEQDIAKEETKDDEELASTPEKKSISSDQLLEMLESEDPVDLEDIRLIKAPKRELAGLKVLGKVELAAPVKKESKSEKASREAEEKNQRRQLSEEEKEKRRLKAKRKKEAYEAKIARLKKEKEAKKLKEIKEMHYRKKLDQQQPIGNHKKKQAANTPPSKPEKSAKVPPKSLLGKFWRWMNT